MNSNTIIKKYFLWLVDLVDEDSKKDCGGYIFLLNALFKKEFYWTIEKDENRANDGKHIREIFSEIEGLDSVPDQINGPCNVLEMIIALADRWHSIEDSDLDGDENRKRYFWEMIKNLGLEGCTDDKFDSAYVRRILDRLLDREYDSDGSGGLFPLKNCENEDLRNVELWYQLQRYLIEKEM